MHFEYCQHQKISKVNLADVQILYILLLPVDVAFMESLKRKKERLTRIFEKLNSVYPDAHCELNHSNALELLVATILSAQCTDKRVNMVTAKLFEKYRCAEDYLKVAQEELQEDIRETGFFRNKAKNIQGACRMIVDEFKGAFPDTMENLIKLPGVGRKTANVVLGTAFEKNEGIVVDTHVIRLSKLLGLTQSTDPEKIEQDLMALLPQAEWTLISHLLVWHGRRRCSARKPDCSHCEIQKCCPHFSATFSKSN